MKLSIPKSEIQRGLARLQSIVEKRNTMPILANVLITASGSPDDGRLELAATDLEVGLRSAHPATVEATGTITASAKKLYEIVRELPDEPVHIEVSANSYVQVRCARAAFSLAGSAAEEYPTLPAFLPERMAVVQAIIVGEMIEKTLYAASLDETRYNLNGVYLEYRADTHKIRMVATDGHRLAYVDRAIGDDLEHLAKGVIIPRKGVAELKRLIDEDDGDELEIGFEGNSALTRKGSVTLMMRLIEGEFPQYQQVIPRDAGQQLTLASDTLNQALRRVALLSSERSRAVRLKLKPGSLSLSSSNPDLGEAHEELDIDYAGDELEIAFNARYLLDALGAIHAKEATLEFRDSLSPARLLPAGDDDALAVVMPMRL